MHTTILTPPPKRLPLPPKQPPKQAPQQNQTRIRHNRRNKPILLRPHRNKLAKPIPPNVLIDRDAHKQATCHGLVAIDGVGGGDGGERGDLDAGAGEADDDDGFPGPVVLVADGHDDVAQVHDYDVGYHGGETHFGFADTVVFAGGAGGDPVGKGAGGEEADHGADEDGEVHEACDECISFDAREVVRDTKTTGYVPIDWELKL